MQTLYSFRRSSRASHSNIQDSQSCAACKFHHGSLVSPMLHNSPFTSRRKNERDLQSWKRAHAFCRTLATPAPSKCLHHSSAETSQFKLQADNLLYAVPLEASHWTGQLAVKVFNAAVGRRRHVGAELADLQVVASPELSNRQTDSLAWKTVPYGPIADTGM